MSGLAALYVETGGCHFGLDGVAPWDEARDARRYAGPHPVVAHPPCERWGRFWHGSPRKPHQFKLGDDGGCFAAALASVRQWGGVLVRQRDRLDIALAEARAERDMADGARELGDRGA